MLRLVNAISLCFLSSGAIAGPSGIVSRIVDGDGLYVGGIEVRLHGIDAPESWQKCTTELGGDFACGKWVTRHLEDTYLGQHAQCETTAHDEKYDRIVARCYVEGVDIGRQLVADGLAFAYRKYSRDYYLDEKAAAANDRGLHAHRVQTPSWVRATRAKGRMPPDPNCRIKGNISSRSNEKIYHVPGQRFYERTGIRRENDERWFCTQAEARAAGWRRAQH